ncbi:MAG: hypothetical protein JXA54_07605 [Candidatus Heimdallarchaeota archaeon]|nr:hypothetical protein [Candidatus Heimdallarchaeota archaeon]
MVQEKDEYGQLGNVFNADYLFQIEGDTIYFETWNQGNVMGEYDDSLGYPLGLPKNCNFENRFQIVFDKNTGVLLGMTIQGETMVEEKLAIYLTGKSEKRRDKKKRKRLRRRTGKE